MNETKRNTEFKTHYKFLIVTWPCLISKVQLYEYGAGLAWPCFRSFLGRYEGRL